MKLERGIINNNTVATFETSYLWVNKLMQRSKLNEFSKCVNQKINVALTCYVSIEWFKKK